MPPPDPPPPPAPSAHRAWGRVDWAWLGALLALTAFFVQWRSGSRMFLGRNFLEADEGMSLLVADVLARGGKLYQDISYPYGYLPAWLHAGAARVWGNSIATYLHYFLVTDLLALGLIYAWLRKFLEPAGAFCFAVVAVIPETIFPGALYGDNIGNAAYPLERVCLLLLLVLWREPGGRTAGRAGLLGLVLGTMQGIKFGTGIFVGAALAAVDLLAWYQGGFSRAIWRRLVRSGVAMLAGFLAIELVWVVVTLANLPRPIAQDVLWPTYVFKNYASFVEDRYPEWEDLGYFLGIQLFPLIGLVGSLWWLGARLWRRRTNAPAAGGGALLVLLVFYALGCLIFFKHVWHFYLFAWIPVLGGAYFLVQPNRIVRWIFLALAGVNFVWFLKAEAAQPRQRLVAMPLADGETLWVTGQERADFEAMVGVARVAGKPGGGPQRPVVFYPNGSGFYPLFDLPHPGRLSEFMVGFERPYDAPQILELASSGVWIVRGPELPKPISADPGDWDRASGTAGTVLDPAAREAARANLHFVEKIGNSCWIFAPPQ